MKATYSQDISGYSPVTLVSTADRPRVDTARRARLRFLGTTGTIAHSFRPMTSGTRELSAGPNHASRGSADRGHAPCCPQQVFSRQIPAVEGEPSPFVAPLDQVSTHETVDLRLVPRHRPGAVSLQIS
jgi:hypothetical protein